MFRIGLRRRGGGAALAVALLVSTVLGISGEAAAAQPERTADVIADAVLGQPEFTSHACNRGRIEPTASTLCAPTDAAIDPSSGRLYVSDTLNSRVLSWPDARHFTNGEAADLVLGQPDATTGREGWCNHGLGLGAPAFADSLCRPHGLDVDQRGNLYVADEGNSRVVRYARPRRNGQTADLVLGQSDFTSRLCNQSAPPSPPGTPTAQRMCFPTSVAVGPRGEVYVADRSNVRVLRFDRPRTSFEAADLVIGQPDFTTRVGCLSGVSATTLCSPGDLDVDDRGALYATDIDNHRVLRYDRPRTNGHAASLVLGQPDFTSRAAHCSFSGGVTGNGLCQPQGLAVDQRGRVYVADWSARVLGYDRPRVNGQTADLVVGQPDLNTGAQCGRSGLGDPPRVPNAGSLCAPTGLATARRNDLFVSDMADHRVLLYDRIGRVD